MGNDMATTWPWRGNGMVMNWQCHVHDVTYTMGEQNCRCPQPRRNLCLHPALLQRLFHVGCFAIFLIGNVEDDALATASTTFA